MTVGRVFFFRRLDLNRPAIRVRFHCYESVVSWRSPDALSRERCPFEESVCRVLETAGYARSADRPPAAGAFLACPVQPGAGAFAYSYAFLFGDGGEDRNDGIAKDAGRVKVLLGV
jgi:hypothetical protein